jgi:hypothetical protein
MKIYRIHPEVPGGIGKNMDYDKTEVPWKITQLSVVFEGWLGGDLLKISTCYIVTDTLKEKIISANLTGIYNFVDFDLDYSLNFKNLYPNKILPKMHWMQLGSDVGKVDLAIGEKNKLFVSEKAMNVLKTVDLSDAEIQEIIL